MSAPNLTYTYTKSVISDETGFNYISVTFSADAEYQAFQCRATKAGEDWGIGRGTLCASFSQTPANTQRTFEIYDSYLVNGDGEYRISLFVQGMDGTWNDNYPYIPVGNSAYITTDGVPYLCIKEV